MLEILQSVRPLEKNDLVQKSEVGRTSLALVVIQFDNLIYQSAIRPSPGYIALSVWLNSCSRNILPSGQIRSRCLPSAMYFLVS